MRREPCCSGHLLATVKIIINNGAGKKKLYVMHDSLDNCYTWARGVRSLTVVVTLKDESTSEQVGDLKASGRIPHNLETLVNLGHSIAVKIKIR